MSATKQLPRFTLGDFLAWEEAQEGKHEFVDGEVVAMVATKRRLWIAQNICRVLHEQLVSRGSFPFLRFQLRAGANIYYPDVVVTSGSDAIEGSQIERPSLIAEVCEPSSASYVWRLRRKQCQDNLPSLRTYMLVAHDAILVEVLQRTEVGWLSEVFMSPDDVIEVSEPPCRLALAQIYKGLLEVLGTARSGPIIDG